MVFSRRLSCLRTSFRLSGCPIRWSAWPASLWAEDYESGEVAYVLKDDIGNMRNAEGAGPPDSGDQPGDSREGQPRSERKPSETVWVLEKWKSRGPRQSRIPHLPRLPGAPRVQAQGDEKTGGRVGGLHALSCEWSLQQREESRTPPGTHRQIVTASLATHHSPTDHERAAVKRVWVVQPPAPKRRRRCQGERSLRGDG